MSKITISEFMEILSEDKQYGNKDFIQDIIIKQNQVNNSTYINYNLNNCSKQYILICIWCGSKKGRKIKVYYPNEDECFKFPNNLDLANQPYPFIVTDPDKESFKRILNFEIDLRDVRNFLKRCGYPIPTIIEEIRSYKEHTKWDQFSVIHFYSFCYLNYINGQPPDSTETLDFMKKWPSNYKKIEKSDLMKELSDKVITPAADDIGYESVKVHGDQISLENDDIQIDKQKFRSRQFEVKRKALKLGFLTVSGIPHNE